MNGWSPRETPASGWIYDGARVLGCGLETLCKPFVEVVRQIVQRRTDQTSVESRRMRIGLKFWSKVGSLVDSVAGLDQDAADSEPGMLALKTVSSPGRSSA